MSSSGTTIFFGPTVLANKLDPPYRIAALSWLAMQNLAAAALAVRLGDVLP